MFLYIKRDFGTKFTSLNNCTTTSPPGVVCTVYRRQLPSKRGGVSVHRLPGGLPYKSDGNALAVLKLQILVSLFGMETVLAGFVWTGGQTAGEKFLFCNKNGYVDWALLGSLT